MNAQVVGADQLAVDPDAVHAPGLLAPAATQVLSAEELAKILGDDDDESAPLEGRNHGAIDQVDSRLVTELQKKLRAEASSEGERHLSQEQFHSDLSAALARGLATGQCEERLATSSSDVEFQSGVLAPQPTMHVGDLLAGLDDSTHTSRRSSHGPIDQLNDQLLAEVQRKLGESGSEVSLTNVAVSSSGLLAPQTTTVLSSGLLQAVDDEEDRLDSVEAIDLHLVSELQRKLGTSADHDNEGALKGCLAPHSTVKLSADMLQRLDDD